MSKIFLVVFFPSICKHLTSSKSYVSRNSYTYHFQFYLKQKVASTSFRDLDAAPHARPAPRTITRVWRGVIADWKNATLYLLEQNIIPSTKRGGWFRSGNSFSRIAPPSPGVVSGVKVSVVVKKKNRRLFSKDAAWLGKQKRALSC